MSLLQNNIIACGIIDSTQVMICANSDSGLPSSIMHSLNETLMTCFIDPENICYPLYGRNDKAWPMNIENGEIGYIFALSQAFLVNIGIRSCYGLIEYAEPMLNRLAMNIFISIFNFKLNTTLSATDILKGCKHSELSSRQKLNNQLYYDKAESNTDYNLYYLIGMGGIGFISGVASLIVARVSGLSLTINSFCSRIKNSCSLFTNKKVQTDKKDSMSSDDSIIVMLNKEN